MAKQDPLERVGNVVEVDGRLHVIEYSDLPDEIAARRKPDGSLAIWAGSIAVHVIDVAFLARMAGRADALPFHVARKKVAHVDAPGGRVEPGETSRTRSSSSGSSSTCCPGGRRDRGRGRPGRAVSPR